MNTNHTKVDTIVPTEVGDCLFKSWMVDWRYLSLALKHDLAVSTSVRQEDNNSLLSCQQSRKKPLLESWSRICTWFRYNSASSKQPNSFAICGYKLQQSMMTFNKDWSPNIIPVKAMLKMDNSNKNMLRITIEDYHGDS